MEMRSLSAEQVRENGYYIPLLSGRHGFIFGRPAYKEVPFVSRNYSGSDTGLGELVGAIENYLLNSFVVGMGTNVHEEESKIIKTFSIDEFNWFKSHNKLGTNCFRSWIDETLFVLRHYHHRDDLVLDPVLMKEFEEYGSHSFVEKIGLCRMLDQEAYKILEKLGGS